MLKADAVRKAHTKILAATTDANETQEAIAKAEITSIDREIVRGLLKEAAEHIRKKYGLQIPVIKRFLYEMVSVT